MLNFVKELSKIPGSSAEVAFAYIEKGYTFGVWVLFLALVKRGSGESLFASFEEEYTTGEQSGCGSGVAAVTRAVRSSIRSIVLL